MGRVSGSHSAQRAAASQEATMTHANADIQGRKRWVPWAVLGTRRRARETARDAVIRAPDARTTAQGPSRPGRAGEQSESAPVARTAGHAGCVACKTFVRVAGLS